MLVVGVKGDYLTAVKKVAKDILKGAVVVRIRIRVRIRVRVRVVVRVRV